MSIIARRLQIIYKTGRVVQYSHVTGISTLGSAVIIQGERDGKDMRVNATDTHIINKLLIMVVDWYVPITTIVEAPIPKVRDENSK